MPDYAPGARVLIRDEEWVVRTKFSINLYGTARSSARFRHIANLYAPATVSESLNHLGGGATPGIKHDEGGWNTAGHANRVIEVDDDVLTTFAPALRHTRHACQSGAPACRAQPRAGVRA